MKDLLEILAAYQESDPNQLVLATVVGVEGSTYRRPGAHMLIRCPDRTFGMVSGGCLDNDLCVRAAEVLRTQHPDIISYDSRQGDDTLWGLGLGCNGKVDILLEPMNTGAAWLDFARDRLSRKRPGLVLTQHDTGGRLFWTPRGWRVHGELSDELRRRVLSSASELLKAGQNQVWEGALLETVEPPWPLLVCGAGPDALPVARLAREMGWDVQVTDPRQHYASRFLAARVLLGEPAEMLTRLRVTDRTAAVIMAHHYETDREYLRALLASSAGYIGLLGPRKRTERLLAELGADDEERIFGPIGHDLGADNPDEIALSILAEILAWRHQRTGGSLRKRQAPIHSGGTLVRA